MTDIDGVIASAGWDFDLDGVIDQNSTGFRAFENLSIPSSTNIRQNKTTKNHGTY